MVFSTPLFLFIFLPLVLVIYYLIPQRYVMAKNIELLIASLLFYAWGEPFYVLLMLLSIAANYIFGILLDKYDASIGARRAVLVISVVYNLGMLFFFKYFNFFADTFGVGELVPVIALPIGISFFTFQIMSYTIDVYLRNCAPQKSVFKLALYISLFPQLIAGPIVRYIDVERELTYRTCDVDSVFKGVVRFSVGLAKKVVISNTVAALAETIFAMEATSLSAATAWVGAIAYTLQIYFDFSGYSDMAIGLGHMMGFHFLENFNYPYISYTVQEFWRRWHMSLSSWFKDYLYIPLGGNRKGKIRTYINLLIVFACTGFWHGASWNFLVWGLFHGFFLVLERIFLKKVFDKIPKPLHFIGHIYTLLVAIIGWVLFNAKDLTTALHYIGSMFRFTNFGWLNAAALLDAYTVLILLIGVIFSIPIIPKLGQLIRRLKGGETALTIISGASMAALMLISIYSLSGSGYNPFIYFRF